MSETTPRHIVREVVKNYTTARKFPQLIGTTPDGKKLFGGPYTYTQFIGAGVVAVVLWKTPGIWATGSMMRNGVVFLLVTALSVWGLGKLPLGGRNPLSMVHGVGKALGASSQAPKVNGKAPRRPTLRALNGRVTVLDPADPRAAGIVVAGRERSALSVSEHHPVDDVPPRQRSVTAPAPAASTGAQRLVAMAAASHSAREKA